MGRLAPMVAAVLVAFGFGGAFMAMETDGTPEECPIPADIVVTDQLQLRDAVAWASPGTVIAVDGIIELTPPFYADDFFGGLQINESITLTCATPGSGLRIRPPMRTVATVYATAVIDHLVLDASEITEMNNTTVQFQGLDSSGSVLSNNLILCPTLVGSFFANSPGATVTGNTFYSSPWGTVIGVRLQQNFEVDTGSRIERNRFTAQAPSPNIFGLDGAISSLNVGRSSQGLVVSHNTVSGPWFRSVDLGTVSYSQFPHSGARLEFNHFEGTTDYGMLLEDLTGGVVRNNVVRNSGLIGAYLDWVSCGNVFAGNNVSVGNEYGVFMSWGTAGNTLVGDGNVVVDDGGWFDCDGDGAVDPNIINGADAVLHGVNLGSIVSEAMKSVGGGHVDGLAVASEIYQGFCGDSLCEPGLGEDCLSCAEDCSGLQKGKKSLQYCCGDGDGAGVVGCDGTRCTCVEGLDVSILLSWEDARSDVIAELNASPDGSLVVPEPAYVYVNPDDGSPVESNARYVDVHRDGTLLETTLNDGAYEDEIGRTTVLVFNYQICESGTSRCTEEITVSF